MEKWIPGFEERYAAREDGEIIYISTCEQPATWGAFAVDAKKTVHKKKVCSIHLSCAVPHLLDEMKGHNDCASRMGYLFT
jgi:hypothetical protein